MRRSSTSTASTITSRCSRRRCSAGRSTASAASTSSRSRTARKELAAVDERLAALGGDERDRAREIDLLRFQVDELAAAGVDDPDEDDVSATRRSCWPTPAGTAEAAAAAVEALTGDGGAADAVARGHRRPVDDRPPFAEAASRLRGRRPPSWPTSPPTCASGARRSRTIPSAQAEIGARRQLLQDLRRKYGEPSPR